MRHCMLSAMILVLCAAAQAEVRQVKATAVQEGQDRFLVLEDGQRLKIDRIGGRAQKTIDKAIKSGQAKQVIYNDQGGRILVTWIDDQLPPTAEEQAASRQQQMEHLLAVGDAAVTEFKFIPGAWCTPRGVAVIGDGVITQQLPPNTGRPGDKVGTVIVGRLPAVGRHYEALPMEHYRQVVRIGFADARAAAAAYLAPLPVYNAHRMAFTCRWDDNNAEGDLRGVLAATKVGVYATCFLNGAEFVYAGMGHRNLSSKDIKDILAAGSSIGNHSENHNLKGELAKLTSNEQFRETYLPRAQRESQGDCPVMTVAPPHNKFGDARTMENWRNSGHYGFANDGPGARGYSANNVIIAREATEPLQFHSAFHASNLKGNASLAAAVEQWTQIGKDERIWKATFSQYCAYRYQYQHTPIRKSLEGSTAVFELYRPELLDLNDTIPLTLVVRGAEASAVKRVHVEHGRTQRLDGAAGYLFNLHHDSGRSLPGIVALRGPFRVEDETDVAGVETKLSADGSGVRLNVKNASSRPMRDLAVTYRLPHGWTPPVLRLRVGELAAGASWSDTPPAALPADAELRRGPLLIGAQLDFRLGDDPARLHVLSHLPGEPNEHGVQSSSVSRLCGGGCVRRAAGRFERRTGSARPSQHCGDPGR